MTRFLTLAALLLTLTALPAKATEYWLLVPVTSHHFMRDDRPNNYNQRNYGIGLDVRNIGEDSGIQVGTYRNSINRQTVYGALNLSLLRHENVRLGILAGAMSGYPGSKVFVAPVLSYEGERYGTDLTFLPGAMIKGGDNAVALSFRIRF